MARWTGLALIVVVLAGCEGAAAPTASPTLAPAAITVEAQGPGAPSDPAAIPVAFMPATFEIQAGDIVRLVDAGDTEHDLTIDVGGKVPTTTAEQNVPSRSMSTFSTRRIRQRSTCPLARTGSTARSTLGAPSATRSSAWWARLTCIDDDGLGAERRLRAP